MSITNSNTTRPVSFDDESTGTDTTQALPEQAPERKISVEEFRQRLLDRGADSETVEQMIAMYDDGEAGEIPEAAGDGFISEGELLFHAESHDYLIWGLNDRTVSSLLNRPIVSYCAEHDFPEGEYAEYQQHQVDYSSWR